MPQSRFRSILEDMKRENAHDPHYFEWKADRISHWSEISVHRINRILAGEPPFKWEAEKIINAIGGKLKKMLPLDIFGEVIGISSDANTSRLGNVIIDDSEPSKDRSFHRVEEPSAISQ